MVLTMRSAMAAASAGLSMGLKSSENSSPPSRASTSVSRVAPHSRAELEHRLFEFASRDDLVAPSDVVFACPAMRMHAVFEQIAEDVVERGARFYLVVTQIVDARVGGVGDHQPAVGVEHAQPLADVV